MVKAMRRLTLTQQWLLATLLAILPLLLAVTYAISSLAEQTRQHRRVLLSTSLLKDLEASIAQQIGGLERANMQYLLLGDERFNQLYQERLVNLNEYQTQIEQSLVDGPELTALNSLITQLKSPPALPDSTAANKNIYPAQDFWRTVTEKRLDFNQQIKTLTQEAIDQSEETFQVYFQRLIVIVSLAIPGTVLLIILSTVAVARSWWRLVDTIRRMGEQDWQHPIEIDGPADFVELGRNLEWMREQLLAIERQKQTFSQHVTHELKSPLAAIIEAEALLRDQLPGPINPSQQKVLDILRANADSLSDLIQQFLNFNTVLNNLTPEVENVNIHAMYAKVREQLDSANPNRKIEWRWHGDTVSVNSDTFCMQMILSNLMSNACKAVPDHGVVTVSVGQSGENWFLIVEDNGPGVPEHEREKIFKPFYQGKISNRGSLKGNGIGLSIVQECVQKLSGHIVIDVSSLGGAKFTLQFPAVVFPEVKYA